VIVIRREGLPPVTLKSGFEPFQICFLVAFALWGTTAMLALNKVSSETVKPLPQWGIYLFFAGLTGGSALAIAGVVYERRFAMLRGFYVERAGLIALTGLSAGYIVWAAAAFGWQSAGIVYILGAIFSGSLWRIVRITRDLRAVMKGTES
jgi:hypothetical protein